MLSSLPIGLSVLQLVLICGPCCIGASSENGLDPFPKLLHLLTFVGPRAGGLGYVLN
jgi:hypothetical protein